MPLESRTRNTVTINTLISREAREFLDPGNVLPMVRRGVDARGHQVSRISV
jgi:hypothetical protein